MRTNCLLNACELVIAFTFVATFVLAVLEPALSQTVDTTVPVSPFLEIIRPYIEMVVGLIISGVLTWLATILKTKVGVDIEKSHREAIQTALTNGAGLLIARGGAVLGDVRLDVKSPLLREAIAYVEKSASDAIAYFDLTPTGLAEKLIAKVPQLAVSAPAVPDASRA